MKKSYVVPLPLILVLLVSLGMGQFFRVAYAEAKPEERVFEMRTYYTNEGKLDALNDRFRNHTNALFVKHGMKLIAYWTPTDGDAAENTLIYVLAHDSRAAAEASWKAFFADPEWKAVYAEYTADGKLVNKVDSVFMAATDYSPIR